MDGAQLENLIHSCLLKLPLNTFTPHLISASFANVAPGMKDRVMLVFSMTSVKSKALTNQG